MKCLLKPWALALMISFGFLGEVSAENLLDVYQDALQNDPSFAKAQATWQAAKLNLPLAMTGNGSPGSGLFPNISLNGNVGKTYYGYGNGYNAVQNSTYGITITQPLFNFATWKAISSAGFSVKAATAQYFAATQDLVKRVANAYFEVLRAYDMLQLVQAKKAQIYQEYKTTWNEYVVGVLAITPVYDAKAKYDQVLVEEIADKNKLQNAINNLAVMTGKQYPQLNAVKETIPLVTPKPQNLDKWLEIGDRQNYLLQADLNNMLAAQQNIKLAEAGMAPTVNMMGDYQGGKISSNMPIKTGDPGPRQTSVGLSLNFPVFRGGYDIVNTKKTKYLYLAASDQLEIDHRSVKNQLQQGYLGLQSGILQIKADQKAIFSAEQQLSATKAGYEVGTRTMVDVLNSLASLTLVKQQYANDRYNYLESILSLKEMAGTLSPEDLAALTQWLGEAITLVKS